MGVFDCTSVYGNRDGAQEGLNFDHLDRSIKDPRAIPDYSVEVHPDNMNTSSTKARPFSAKMVDDALRDDDDDLGISVEGAELAIEVFLVESRAFPEMPSEHSREYDKTEQIFAKTVYPRVVATKVYGAVARPGIICFEPATFTYSREHLFTKDELAKVENRLRMRHGHPCSYKPGKYGTPLPLYFFYHEYSAYGIFKFTGDSRTTSTIFPHHGPPTLTPRLLFPEIDPSKQEVWMRVWYYQVWEGIAQAPRYTSFLTDPCLVWTCHELGILAYDEIPTHSRAWLWAEARRLILQRQYPDRHFREYALPLLLGHSADPACVFYKDNVPLDMLLLMFRDVFGAAAVARAKRVRSLTAHKRQKVEERDEK